VNFYEPNYGILSGLNNTLYKRTFYMTAFCDKELLISISNWKNFKTLMDLVKKNNIVLIDPKFSLVNQKLSLMSIYHDLGIEFIGNFLTFKKLPAPPCEFLIKKVRAQSKFTPFTFKELQINLDKLNILSPTQIENQKIINVKNLVESQIIELSKLQHKVQLLENEHSKILELKHNLKEIKQEAILKIKDLNLDFVN
jgi:hypothetical protein